MPGSLEDRPLGVAAAHARRVWRRRSSRANAPPPLHHRPLIEVNIFIWIRVTGSPPPPPPRLPPQVGVAIGLHWIPSMCQLHVHVVSRDFDSDHLKQPKHWKSFTTAYFRPLDAVISEVDERGLPRIDVAAAESLLKGPLECNRCLRAQRNLPALKRHLAVCTADVQRP